MIPDSKIYLAGHNGLVGSAILRRLQAGGYVNIVTRRSRELDLTRQAAVEAFFEKEKPEYVFLAAAKVGGIMANSTYKAEFIYQNIMIASNVIQAACQYRTKKLLNLGSSCIYPKFAPQPMKEDYLLTGALEPTNEPYAIAKIAAIKLCRYYNEQYGTNFISAMPANLYGTKDNFDLLNSHALPAMIRKFHEAKERQDKNKAEVKVKAEMETETKGDKDKPEAKVEGKAKGEVRRANDSSEAVLDSSTSTSTCQSSGVVLWGTGAPFREFLYVDDLADACVFLMEHYDAKDIGEFVNIGSGTDMTIRELAELIKGIVGFEGMIRWDTTKPDGTPKKLLDISRIRALGWQPKISLEDGIRKTYAWYLETVKSEVKVVKGQDL